MILSEPIKPSEIICCVTTKMLKSLLQKDLKRSLLHRDDYP
jgi:hypothetical protein